MTKKASAAVDTTYSQIHNERIGIAIDPLVSLQEKKVIAEKSNEDMLQISLKEEQTIKLLQTVFHV